MVALVDGGTGEERALVALWVHPGHRRDGVASALVSQVVDWARRDGADRLTLWVAHGNEPARHLYLRHGFAGSGERKPLPSNPVLEEEQMVLWVR